MATLNEIHQMLGAVLNETSALKEEAAKQSKLADDRDKDASENRGKTYRSLEVLHTEVAAVRSEVKALDVRITDMEPGWKDYQKKMYQVEGAGKLGAGLWWFGGWLLSAAAALTSAFYWFTSTPKN